MFQKPTDDQLNDRYRHHILGDEQADRCRAIRAKCLELAKFVRDNTPCCPDQSLAFTALDEVMFRANAAIARNES